MIKNIRFEYDENIHPDKDRETYLTHQSELWFSPLIEEINNQSGTIEFFLKDNFENRVSFNGIDKDLIEKMSKRIDMFRVSR